MAALNYAKEYSRALANAYPYTLNFGRLYTTENDRRYRMGENGKGIYIPRVTTSGRVAGDRDAIVEAKRNFDNSWEYKPLTNHRMWSTLVHPKDIDQTNEAASIQNITQTFNETQKFPEKDAYLISQLYKLYTTADTTNDSEDVAKTADTTALTAETVLGVFDSMMEGMDDALVPPNGRILYVTPSVNRLIKQAEEIVRNFSVQRDGSKANRTITNLDNVDIIVVPSILMKTKYVFTSGWAPADDAVQINMFLVHPTAVITPEYYEFAQLDSPSAMTNGKYYYFEEAFEDVFVLNKRKDALAFNVVNPSQA